MAQQAKGDFKKLTMRSFMIFDSHLNIMQAIRGMGIRWMRHVAHMERKNVHSVWVGNMKGNRPPVRPRSKWKIVLKYIINK